LYFLRRYTVARLARIPIIVSPIVRVIMMVRWVLKEKIPEKESADG
jgi:hypothetical protein